MVRDVDYAFFAQLSYLNWNKLKMNELKEKELYKEKEFINFLNRNIIWNEIKLSDTVEPTIYDEILMYDENDKRLFGVFGIKKSKK